MVRPAHLVHLAKRFVTSLDPRPPAAGDEAWATDHLLPGEVDLWRRMSPADRRHAIDVAQRASATPAVRAAGRAGVAAALLHDVGKVEASIGTFGRALVTAAALVVGRDRLMERRPEGRAARYLRHDEIGGDVLSDAGADGLTIAWAREHHLPEARWTVPPDVASALKAADDD